LYLVLKRKPHPLWCFIAQMPVKPALDNKLGLAINLDQK